MIRNNVNGYLINIIICQCFVVIIIINLHNKTWFTNVFNVQYNMNQIEMGMCVSILMILEYMHQKIYIKIGLLESFTSGLLETLSGLIENKNSKWSSANQKHVFDFELINTCNVSLLFYVYFMLFCLFYVMLVYFVLFC